MEQLLNIISEFLLNNGHNYNSAEMKEESFRSNTLEALNIDSLDLVDLIWEVEDTFSIQIEDEAIQSDWTIGQLIDHLGGCLNE